MKHIIRIIPLVLIAFLISCKQSGKNDEINPGLIHNSATASGKQDGKKMPVLEFKKTTHDFGDVFEGGKVSYSFKFTNTGKSDLIISNCVPSCGCTVPEFPRKPIKAGKSDYITVIFDSKGRSGTFDKSISVYSNTLPNVVQINIKGNVIKK